MSTSRLVRSASTALVFLVLSAGAAEAVIRSNPITHPPRVRRSQAGQVLETLHVLQVRSLETTASVVAATGSGLVVSDGATTMKVLVRKGATGYQQAGSVEMPGSIIALDAAGDRVAVSCAWEGTVIVDVSNPASPSVIAHVPAGSSARSVAMVGSTGFVADWSSGLEAINIGSGEDDRVLGFGETPGHAYDVAVAGQRAYVADFEGGVRVFDVRNPRAMRAVGAWQMMPSATGIAVRDGYAYVVDEQLGLFVVSIRNPDSPRVVAQMLMEVAPRDVTLTPTRALVSDRAGGISLFDITRPNDPRPLGRTQYGSRLVDVTTDGSRVYVAAGRLLSAETER